MVGTMSVSPVLCSALVHLVCVCSCANKTVLVVNLTGIVTCAHCQQAWKLQLLKFVDDILEIEIVPTLLVTPLVRRIS